MRTDSEVHLHRVWAETKRVLELCARRVAENRDVLGSLDFARYVLNSGLIELCDANASGAGELRGGLVVDGKALREKADEVRRACQLRFSAHDETPSWEAMELQSLHEKLDGIVSALAGAGVVAFPAPAARRSRLRVFSGGLARKGRGVGSVQKRKVA